MPQENNKKSSKKNKRRTIPDNLFFQDYQWDKDYTDFIDISDNQSSISSQRNSTTTKKQNRSQKTDKSSTSSQTNSTTTNKKSRPQDTNKKYSNQNKTRRTVDQSRIYLNQLFGAPSAPPASRNVQSESQSPKVPQPFYPGYNSF